MNLQLVQIILTTLVNTTYYNEKNTQYNFYFKTITIIMVYTYDVFSRYLFLKDTSILYK